MAGGAEAGPEERTALVIGFSVTEPQPGYIDDAKALAAAAGGRLRIVKTAIGGCQPKKLKFLMDSILAAQAPDLVVLEIGTFGFAGTGTSAQRHPEDIAAILHSLARAGCPVGFLDLPRRDHAGGGDWVHACHAAICRDLGLPYVRAELREAWLKDVVHPTAEGAAYYARCLMDLLAQLDRPGAGRIDAGRLAAETVSHDMLAAVDLAPPEAPGEVFQRAGYRVPVLLVPAGQAVRLAIPQGWLACGLGYVTGPLAGTVEVTAGGRKMTYPCYDQWAYYARASFVEFEPVRTDWVEVRQRPDLPDVALLKGEPDMGPRLGKLISVLVQRPL